MPPAPPAGASTSQNGWAQIAIPPASWIAADRLRHRGDRPGPDAGRAGDQIGDDERADTSAETLLGEPLGVRRDGEIAAWPRGAAGRSTCPRRAARQAALVEPRSRAPPSRRPCDRAGVGGRRGVRRAGRRVGVVVIDPVAEDVQVVDSAVDRGQLDRGDERGSRGAAPRPAPRRRRRPCRGRSARAAPLPRRRRAATPRRRQARRRSARSATGGRTSGRSRPRSLWAGEPAQPSRPGGVEVGPRREAAVQLEDRHPVGEGPQGPRGVAVPAGCLDAGNAARSSAPGTSSSRSSGPAGHEPVEMRVLAGERAVAAAPEPRASSRRASRPAPRSPSEITAASSASLPGRCL